MKRLGIAALFSLQFLFCVGIADAQADEETLADIRVQLEGLRSELRELQSELGTRAALRTDQDRAVSENVLLRIDSLETELRESIGKIQQLESRINAVLRQGSVQLRDLELRLVELEGGDVSQIDWGMTLGGVPLEQQLPLPDPAGPEIDPNDPELLERRSFRAAKEIFESGNLAAAELQFANFIAAFPESAYLGEAHYYVGESLFRKQEWEQAARSYLASYQSSLGSPLAPEAAWRLAESLGRMGRQSEACQIFELIAEEFRGTDQANAARLRLPDNGCV